MKTKPEELEPTALEDPEELLHLFEKLTPNLASVLEKRYACRSPEEQNRMFALLLWWHTKFQNESKPREWFRLLKELAGFNDEMFEKTLDDMEKFIMMRPELEAALKKTDATIDESRIALEQINRNAQDIMRENELKNQEINREIRQDLRKMYEAKKKLIQSVLP